MFEKILLDNLCYEYVDLRIERYSESGELVGIPWRRTYKNSNSNEEFSIEDVKREVIEPYKSAILAVWGVAQ